MPCTLQPWSHSHHSVRWMLRGSHFADEETETCPVSHNVKKERKKKANIISAVDLWLNYEDWDGRKPKKWKQLIWWGDKIMGPFFSLVNISVVFMQWCTILQDGEVDFKHPRGDVARKPMGEGSWAVSLVISASHSSCPSPSPPSLRAHFPALSQHLCQLLHVWRESLGETPSPAQMGFGSF